MKFASLLLSGAALWAQAPANQNVQKVFYFTKISSPQAEKDLVTALRTAADVQQATIDDKARSLTVSAPADKIDLAGWLFNELDQTAAPIQSTVIHEYPLPVQGPSGPEVAKVFYLAHADTQQFLTDLKTGVRTIADVTRLFPDNALQALVARSTADRVTVGEWLARELDQPAGSVQTPAVHAYGSPLALSTRETDVLKVFYLAHAENQQALTDMVTAIRTVADCTRLFPFNSAKALMLACTPDRMAAAEWMFHDLDQPPSDSLKTSTYGVRFSLSPRDDDTSLTVFHLSPAITAQDLTRLITLIRTTTGIPRVFPANMARAIALRGNPAAVAQAETLVKLKDQPPAQ